MSQLKATIQADVVTAMKAKDAERLGVLRMLSAAIKQREVEERIVLTDSDILAVVEKMIKQRKEALTQFQAAGRTDLVDKESFEITVLQVYLPEPLSEDELAGFITKAIQEAGASSARDMGKVMTLLKDKIQGRADMSIVSQKVKTQLNG